MNYGPLLFLAAFAAMSASWFGFVIGPQAQLGRQQPAAMLGSPVTYPANRSGEARQGLQIYRANGCVECHSQQVRQTGTKLIVQLVELGTNQPALAATLKRELPSLPEAELTRAMEKLPAALLTTSARPDADVLMKAIAAAGGKCSLQIVPVGPDLERGWGKRRTVAGDFLYDSPVLPGYQRMGPDLANVGARNPDLNWQLCHLFWPRSEVAGSGMPACEFLFEKLPLGAVRSPDALVFPAGTDPVPGFQVIPTPAARSLAAYLLSLRADAPLFEAPFSAPAVAATSTNAPAVAPGSTNAPAPAAGTPPANPPKTS